MSKNMNYNMKKKINSITKLLLAILLLPTIAACGNDNGGDDASVISPFKIIVKFESPIGTNILDSLNIAEQEVSGHSIDDLTFEWTNKNNDLRESWSQPSLSFGITKNRFASLNPSFPYENKAERVFSAQFTDISIWDTPNNKYPQRDEEYTVTLKSKKIFGNNIHHTLKFYVHIKGKAIYDTYKCEVDGKEQPVISIFYDSKNPPKDKALEGIYLIVKN